MRLTGRERNARWQTILIDDRVVFAVNATHDRPIDCLLCRVMQAPC
jgi:hypothetical protein